MKAVSIRDLSVVYGSGKNQKRAVDHVSFEVESGEFFALLGPNGAGKTTLISSLTGLLDVKFGEVQIYGSPAGSLEAKKQMGVVPQELVHHGFFNVNEVLNFFSGYYGIRNNQKRIDYLLERLALTEQKYKKVSQLSGGMKRRLLIAKALVHSPKLLLLDEPSAGVDIELRALLWDFMTELNRQGTTILLTTHYLEEAERLCERIAIMNEGRLASLDNTGTMLSEMLDKEVSIVLKEGSESLKALGAARENLSCDLAIQKNMVTMTCASKESLEDILKRLDIKISDVLDVKIRDGALEHAFLKVIEKSRDQQKRVS